jgi:hypothetical protein
MTTLMTPTTILHSGANSAGSPCDSARTGDPYAAICSEIHKLLTRKRNYYGCPDDDPLANALAVNEDGIHPVTYQMVRVGEKIRRLRGLLRTMIRSKIRETLCDIAGHAIVAIACLDAEEKE